MLVVGGAIGENAVIGCSFSAEEGEEVEPSEGSSVTVSSTH